jgi:integrase
MRAGAGTIRTLGIKMLKTRGDGFHCWTEEQLEAFESRWPVGTRERLALALLLYTFHRRGDVIRLGPQHIRKGCLTLIRRKTKAKLTIPVHPDLQRETKQQNRSEKISSHGGSSFGFAEVAFSG